MGRAQHLVEHGLFHDALSGAFVVPTDKKNHSHTLAYLLTQTYLEGEQTIPYALDEQRTYRPSWAPIYSVVRVITDETIHSLTVVMGTDALTVIHGHDDDQRHIEVHERDVRTDESVYKARLALPNLQETQDAVRDITQAFFNKLA